MNFPEIAFDRNEFDSLKALNQPPTKPTVTWQGKNYTLLFQSICKKTLAIFLVIVTLGSILAFHSSRTWISDLWSSKSISLLPKVPKRIEPPLSIFLDQKLQFLPMVEKIDSKKLMELDVYPICNETNLEAVSNELKMAKIPEGQKAHIGCAGWYNFDIMAIRKSDYGIIFDINKDSADFMKMTIEFLRLKESKVEFENSIIEYMLKKQAQNSRTFYCKYDFESKKQIPLHDTVKYEKSRKESWLFSEESFQQIRLMAIEGRLGVIQQTMEETTAFQSIKDKLQQQKISVDTLYTSNIANFMDPIDSKSTQSQSFTASVTTLLDDDTLFISSPLLVTADSQLNNRTSKKDKYGKSRIHQIILKGAEVKRNSDLLFINSKKLENDVSVFLKCPLSVF